MLTSYALGTYRAGEQSLIGVSRLYKPDGTRKGCILTHGAGGSALAFLNPIYAPKPEAVAEANFPVAAFDFGDPAVASGTTSGPHNWGNDNAIAAFGDAKTFLEAGGANGQFGAGPDAASTKFFIYGGSMGSLVALNYLISLATPAAVCAGVAMSVPVLDLDRVYQNDFLGFQSEVGDAYGVTFPAALPNLATHSPIAYSSGNKAKLTMPIRLWTSSNDPYAATTANAQAWAATVGANVVVSDLGAVGHSGTGLPIPDLVSFFVTNDI